MNEENIAVPQDKVGKICMHCLGEFNNIKSIKISGMGYGSIFDNTTTQIDLCDTCKSLKPKEWWDMNQIPTDIGMLDDDYIFYKIEFEDEIWEFLNTCPNAGKELFRNRYDNDYYMEPQDWIDYELKILPHEKCKEYCLYSHEEVSAYQDRFPKCGNVVLKIWGDGSSGKRCSYGANESLSSECYMCEHFKLREEEMKIINVEDEFYKREIIRTEESIKHFENYLKKLNNKEVDECDID